MTDPDLSGEPGWDPLAPYWESIGIRSFVSSDPDGDRLRVRYFDADGRTWARAWFGPGAEGPPGHAHGGAQAAVLDEVLGLAGWLAGHPVVMARLEVDMRRMLPLGTVCTVRTEITHVNGRKVHVAGRLVGDDGVVYAEAAGTCVAIGVEQFGIALEG